MMLANELAMNILSIKIILGITLIGFGAIALLIFLEVIAITWKEWSSMVLFSLLVVGVEVLLWYFFKEKSLLKYALIFLHSLIFFFLFSVNAINLAMSPFWLIPVALSLLYFHPPLSIFAGILTSLGNGYFVFTDPGRGMEMVDLSAKATNSLIFVITASALIFITFRGRDLLKKIGQYEEKSREEAETLQDIIKGSKEMAKSTSSLSDSLSQAAMGLSSSFEEITGSTMEASQGAEELMSKGTRLSSFSQEISKDIEESQQVLDTIKEHMDGFEKSIQGFDSYFHELGENVKRVETILLSIEGIAGETNMLALNAAIEAARAGEHGRQFSVVAEEVGNLAGEAGRASKEMNSIVYDIKEQVEDTLGVLTRETQGMKEGISEIHRTREVIGKILPAVQESHGEIQSISSAIQDLSSALESIAAASEQQTAEVQEINTSVDYLREGSKDLLDHLEEFHRE